MCENNAAAKDNNDRSENSPSPARSNNSNSNNNNRNKTKNHTSIVLFYKYFNPSSYPLLSRYPTYYEDFLFKYLKDLAKSLNLKGRILIASEGVNGTLSSSSSSSSHYKNNNIKQFIDTVEHFELVKECGLPPPDNDNDDKKQQEKYDEGEDDESPPPHYLFQDIDWKESSSNEDEKLLLEPFPDLKVAVVKEIINSGNAVSVGEIEKYGGRHLNPKEFHEALSQNPDAVVIDVRNTFEYDIGHFISPHYSSSSSPPQQQQQKEALRAVNPQMTNFSSFDTNFCAKNIDNLRDKKVLMYCTGGIRCEKASAMLKKRGVQDVSQLKGGVHRYLEEYGSNGYFKGLNFVFDQRITQHPSQCYIDKGKVQHQEVEAKNADGDNDNRSNNNNNNNIIIGRCIECNDPFDELSGSRICTVCRDLVLVCPICQNILKEYHCKRHSEWKTCYFTFLEIFDVEELILQREELVSLRDTKYTPACQNRNVRKTISKQIDKINQQIQNLELGLVVVDRNALRRCRTCCEPVTKCDGLCWGFWKTAHHTPSLPSTPGRSCNMDCNSNDNNSKSTPPASPSSEKSDDDADNVGPLPISVGDQVEPGLHWSTLRLGSQTDSKGCLRRGVVLEVKSWGAGGTEKDCVVVKWKDGGDDDSCIGVMVAGAIGGSASAKVQRQQRQQSSIQIYRWGVAALDGERMYDLRKVNKHM